MPNITPHNISLVFDSISDLLQANEGYLKPGMVVQTLGYHTRGDCCPGMFYVMSELGENDVVDGGKVFQSTYTLNTGGRLYFKRVLDETYPVSVSLYGAVGDGVTDDSDAINRCIANNRNIVFEVDKRYRISSSISIINRCGITIDCNNATFLRLSDAERRNYIRSNARDQEIVDFYLFVIDHSTLNYGDYITMNNRNKIVIKNFKCNLGSTGYITYNLTEKSLFKINKPVCEVEISDVTIFNECYVTAISIDNLRSTFTNNDKITLKNISISTLGGYFDYSGYTKWRYGICISRDDVYLENIEIDNFNHAIVFDMAASEIGNIEINGLVATNSHIPTSTVEPDNVNGVIPVPDLKNPAKILSNNTTIDYTPAVIYFPHPYSSSDMPTLKKFIIKNATALNYWAFLIFENEFSEESFIDMDNITVEFNNVYENNTGIKNSYFLYSINNVINTDILKTKLTNSNIIGLKNKYNLFYNAGSSLEHVCENTTIKNFVTAPIDENIRSNLYRESYDKDCIIESYDMVKPNSSCIGTAVLKPYNTMRNLYKTGFGVWYGEWSKTTTSNGTPINANSDNDVCYMTYGDGDGDTLMSYSSGGVIDTHGDYTTNPSASSHISADESGLLNVYDHPLFSEQGISSNAGINGINIPSSFRYHATTSVGPDFSTKLSAKNFSKLIYRPFAGVDGFTGKMCIYDSTYGRDKAVSKEINDLPNPGDMFVVGFNILDAIPKDKINMYLRVKYKVHVPLFYDFNEPHIRSIDPYNRYRLSAESYVTNNGISLSLFNVSNNYLSNFTLNKDNIVTLEHQSTIISKLIKVDDYDISNWRYNYDRRFTFYGRIPSDAFNTLIQNKMAEVYNNSLNSDELDQLSRLAIKHAKYSISDFSLEFNFNHGEVTLTNAECEDLAPMKIHDAVIAKCAPSDTLHFFQETSLNLFNHVYYNMNYGYENSNFTNHKVFFSGYSNDFVRTMNVSPKDLKNSNLDNPVYKEKSFRILSIPWINNIAPYYGCVNNNPYCAPNSNQELYYHNGTNAMNDGNPAMDIIPQPNGFSVKLINANNDRVSEHSLNGKFSTSIYSEQYITLLHINKYLFKKKTKLYFNVLVRTNGTNEEYGKIKVVVDNVTTYYPKTNLSQKTIEVEPGEHTINISVLFASSGETYEHLEMWVTDFYITENPDERYFYKDVKYNERCEIPIYKNGIIAITPSGETTTNFLHVTDMNSPLNIDSGRGQLYITYPVSDEEYDKFITYYTVLPQDAKVKQSFANSYREDIDVTTILLSSASGNNIKSVYPYIYPTNCTENSITYSIGFSDPSNPCCSMENGYIKYICAGNANLYIRINNQIEKVISITCS